MISIIFICLVLLSLVCYSQAEVSHVPQGKILSGLWAFIYLLLKGPVAHHSLLDSNKVHWWKVCPLKVNGNLQELTVSIVVHFPAPSLPLLSLLSIMMLFPSFLTDQPWVFKIMLTVAPPPIYSNTSANSSLPSLWF